MQPLVSIITPSFNQGDYIEETIKSVLGQDYPSIEYVVIDGGSTDNTLDILKRYNKKIRWITEKDNGQADAISKGIRITSGDIVAWLNSDDILLPGAVATVVDCFSHHPDVKMVYGKGYFNDTAGKIIGRYPTEPFDSERLAMFNFICQPSTFFKKDAFNDVGGLDIGLRYALDYDLWIRISRKFQVHYISEFLSSYRLHETSKTVACEHALYNHKEGLDITLKHYNWAPVNRVYGYCYQTIEPILPRSLKKVRLLRIALSLLVSIVKYLQLNRGMRWVDIKALNFKNLRKLSIRWSDIYKDY